MKKNPFKFLVMAVLAMFVAFTACQDYDDDIGRLDKEISTLKTDLANQISTAKSEMQTAINNAVTQVNNKIADLEDQLSKAATKAELAQLKSEIADTYVTKAALQQYQQQAAQALEQLTTRVKALEDNSATKAELAELKGEVTELETAFNNFIGEEGPFAQLKGAFEDFIGDYDDTLENILGELKGELLARIIVLEAVLELQEDGSSAVIEGLEGLIQENADAIEDLKDDVEELFNKVADLRKDLTALQKAHDALVKKVDDVIKDLTALKNSQVLTSLVFYPELYIRGVESLEFRPMIFNFTGLVSNIFGCEIFPLDPPGDIPCIETIGEEYMYEPNKVVRFLGAEPVPAQYHVSPSKLMLDMIDKNNLEVTSHRAEFRLGGVEDDSPNPFSAKFVKLEKGKLFVEYDVNYARLAAAYGLTNPFELQESMYGNGYYSGAAFNQGVLALQVPHSQKALELLPKQADKYVTSDYAQFHIHPIDASMVDILVPYDGDAWGMAYWWGIGYAYYYYIIPSPVDQQGVSEYRTLPDYLGRKEAPETLPPGRPETYIVGQLGWPDADGSPNTADIYAAKLGAYYGSWSGNSYVTLQEGQTLDLADYVKAGLTETATGEPFFHLDETIDGVDLYTKVSNLFDPADYNMKWEFKLLDSNGDPIVYEHVYSETNQQDFIQLLDEEKGTIKATVYGDDPSGAAIGREPIVRVRLIYGEDCVISEAFINVMITPNYNEPVEVVINADGYNVGCDPLTLILSTEEMNRQVYNKLGIDKQKFLLDYVAGGVVDVEGPGTFDWFVDYTYGQTTDRPMLIIGPCDCDFNWETEYAKFTTKVTVTPMGGGPDVVFIFTGELRAPTIDLTNEDLNQAYWLDDFSAIKHHTAVPQSATDDNPDHCTYDNNLNEAFKTHPRGQLKLGDRYIWYSYLFADADKQNQDLVYRNGDPITVTVSTDGKTLFAATPSINGGVPQVVATITDHSTRTIYGNPNPNARDILSYQNNTLAKYMLNVGKQSMWAMLTIDANCDDRDEMFECQDLTVNINGSDEFKVVFLRPISFDTSHKKEFEDGVDLWTAGSWIATADLWQLMDWRGKKFKSATEGSNKHLWGFYGVQNVYVPRLLYGGEIVSPEWDGNGSWEPIPEWMIVAYHDSGSQPGVTYPCITYFNNGTLLAKDCKLRFPVRVVYKWGTVNDWVEIKVKKTTTAP